MMDPLRGVAKAARLASQRDRPLVGGVPASPGVFRNGVTAVFPDRGQSATAESSRRFWVRGGRDAASPGLADLESPELGRRVSELLETVTGRRTTEAAPFEDLMIVDE